MVRETARIQAIFLILRARDNGKDPAGNAGSFHFPDENHTFSVKKLWSTRQKVCCRKKRDAPNGQGASAG